MIDTICLKYYRRIERNDLDGWDETTNKTATGAHYSVYKFNNQLENGARAAYTYYPACYKGFPLLQVEFSLNHVAFGSNICSPQNINETVEMAQTKLNHSCYLPEIPLWAGVLHRLDVFYNHQVGYRVPYYLLALRNLEYPSRKTSPYLNEGVAFPCNDGLSKFYDKERECKEPEAKGMLRQETTLRPKHIKKLVGKKKPTLGDLTANLLENVLTTDLERLHILNLAIPNQGLAFHQLCDLYGSDLGAILFGLLCAKSNGLKKDLIAIATGHSDKKVYRRLKKIEEAKLPLVWSIGEETLPPLTIDPAVILNYFGGK